MPTPTLTYIEILYIELFVTVLVTLFVIIFVGYKRKIPFFLRLLRIQFFFHIIIIEKRVQTHVILQKELISYSPLRFIRYKKEGFEYKIEPKDFFYINYDTAICHRLNIAEALDINKNPKLLTMFLPNSDYSIQEHANRTDKAVNTKVVLDLGKSIWSRKDIIILTLFGLIGIFLTIAVYEQYQQYQILNYVVTQYFHTTTKTG